MSTTGLDKKALAEGELAVQLYTTTSARLYSSICSSPSRPPATSASRGRNWCGFRSAITSTPPSDISSGLDWGDRGYWKVVTPHEVAHQWWGHTVGFNSYRDQWMSEGFADMSASLYLSMIEKNPKKFITFWNDERELLLERNPQGFRAIDAGPLTMGYRTSNSRTGFDTTRRLIYPKGAYVLHMIRMMMRDNRTGDQHFKEMMQDFVKTYSGQSGHHRRLQSDGGETHDAGDGPRRQPPMDWFFNEYVYGTQLPSYQINATFATGSDGDVVMAVKLTQSNVNDSFRMLVPIYLELTNGMFFLGRARLTGNSTFDQKLPLRGLKETPKRAVTSYYDDVLASPN